MAEALNFRVKKAGRELLAQSLQEDLSDWYYDASWTEAAEPTPDDTASRTGSWLIFADDKENGGCAAAVASLLESEGDKCVLVRPGKAFAVSGATATINPSKAEDYHAYASRDH